MEPKDTPIMPPPPSTKATPLERRVEDAERIARYDAQLEARAEQRRKDQAVAETEKFAEARLREWLDAGGSEEDFRRAWPQMMAENLSERRSSGLSRADQERRAKSTPVF